MNAITRTNTIVRASSTSDWPDCNRRGATKLLRKEIIAAGHNLRELPPGIGSAVGTSVHKAASVMLDEKAKSGELPPASVATDAAVETMREHIAPGILFDKSTIDAQEAEAQVLRMVAVYRRDVAPDIQPLIVEERLEARVPWSTQGLILSGQADVIAREPGKVRDLKTGTKKRNHNPQIGSYSLLARSTGIDVTAAGIDFIPRVHITNRTKVQSQPGALIETHNVAIAETAAANVIKHIDMSIKTFREGDEARGILPGDPWAFQANPSSMLCSPKYCPAFGTTFCREHAQTQDEE